ncbi:MAG: late competence development ComFB family protein [Steroidobacteraceae bacterium]
MTFAQVHNYHEKAIFRRVTDRAGHYPDLVNRPELLADVACVALNRLPPRYIRSAIDMAFYMDDAELVQQQAAERKAVDFAFNFVRSRIALGSC